ncbi:UNVERIFIED_CONTAM: hypothetical protein HDU68_008400 [Siphonaria sp. JEL0065]|nr:hypothetical protein HDU68_008400 [Siphonaria sp. JEL0065]
MVSSSSSVTPEDLSILAEDIRVFDSEGNEAPLTILPRVVALYFAASWSPASTEFHPFLVKSVRTHIQASSIAIIHVPADRSEEGYQSMLDDTEFHRLSFPLSKEVSTHFRNIRKSLGLKTFPNLIVLDTRDKRVITADGVNEINIFGALAVDGWIHRGESWPYSWILGARMLYRSVEQQVLRITTLVLGAVLGNQQWRLIGPAPPAATVSQSLENGGVFRRLIHMVFGIGPKASSTLPAVVEGEAPSSDINEDMPPTIHPSKMNVDDSDESIFPDHVSILSATTTKSMVVDRHEDELDPFRFPFPHNLSTTTDLSASALMRTPPPSPIPILKKPNGERVGTGESILSASAMSTISLDASVINMSDSMLSDFRGPRRESVFSNFSPEASMINMSDSLMSDFRGSSKRKVSFSQGLDQYLEETANGISSERSSRKTLGDSIVVVERGIWEDE